MKLQLGIVARMGPALGDVFFQNDLLRGLLILAREDHLVQVIDELEGRLVEIERRLEEATARQDVTLIARLGEEYDQTRSQLEQQLEEWGG